MALDSAFLNDKNMYVPKPPDQDWCDIEELAARAEDIARACKMVTVSRELMLFTMLLEKEFLIEKLNAFNLQDDPQCGLHFFQELYFRYETFAKHGITSEAQSDAVHEIRYNRATLAANAPEGEGAVDTSIEMDVDTLALLKTNLFPLGRLPDKTAADKEDIQAQREDLWLMTFLEMADRAEAPKDENAMHQRTALMKEYLFDEEGDQLLPELCHFMGIDYVEDPAPKAESEEEPKEGFSKNVAEVLDNSSKSTARKDDKKPAGEKNESVTVTNNDKLGLNGG